MSMRQQIGLLYRRFLRASRYVGVRRLPVRMNGRWNRVPIDEWDGFRVVYEPYIERALRRLLKPGDVFVDIGAHFGIWSSLAAELVGPAGTVIACEPSPAFQTLQANLGSNNARVHQVALGSKTATVRFHAQGDATSGSVNPGVTALNREYSPDVPITEVEVAMTTIDTLISQENFRPAVVKIDVEGYELEVLKGASRALSQGTTWIIEIHPPQLKLCGADESDVKNLLDQAGYAIEVIDQSPKSRLYTIVAVKRE
jgi:FkbM family methyltransferase